MPAQDTGRTERVIEAGKVKKQVDITLQFLGEVEMGINKSLERLREIERESLKNGDLELYRWAGYVRSYMRDVSKLMEDIEVALRSEKINVSEVVQKFFEIKEIDRKIKMTREEHPKEYKEVWEDITSTLETASSIWSGILWDLIKEERQKETRPDS